MTQKIYNDKTNIIIDLQLWLSWRGSKPIDLSMFPKLAADRWSWIVANWDSQFFPQFKTFSFGDEYLEENLSILDNHVSSWKSGISVNPLQNMFIFSDCSEFLEQISVQSLTPTPVEADYVAEELKRVSEFTEEDFKQMIKFLKEQRDISFDFVGLGDPVYDRFASRSPSKKQRDFFVSDLDQLNDAIDTQKFIEGILFEFKYQTNLEPNLLDFANQQLTAGGSQVRTSDIYSSFFSVPFEQSLEQMALDYLGDTSFWYELATVNKLKPPYVDLYGTKVFLTENASSNIVRVSSAERNKYQINSSIKIGSRTVPEEVRKVEALRDNEDGTFTVFVSGAQNLSSLRVEHLAFIRVYQPETITDFSFVKIPVSIVAPYGNIPEPTIGELKKLDKALYSFGVDLARDDRSGDLVTSTSGDLALQYGISNVRQAVISLVNTALGELPLHRDYGLPDATGFPMNGGDTASRISSSIETTIKRDQRFTSVSVSDIIIAADGTISMSLNVAIAGESQLIPLAFVI